MDESQRPSKEGLLDSYSLLDSVLASAGIELSS